MPIVQFRVHPGIGCARMGNSDKAYHLASEFPYFLQERFPNVRFRPKPRVHPKSFFKNDDTKSTADGDQADYKIFDTTSAQDRFKEAEGKIFPQAARFRVYAYVFDRLDQRHPTKVFEVTTAVANIEWRVNIANKKSQKTTVSPSKRHENLTDTKTTLVTTDTSLTCRRIRPVAGLPNLGYVFLERDEADKTKVTGRLHVIGNEGDFTGSTGSIKVLWSDDWYDSAGDGSVEAFVKPKPALFAAAGAAGPNDVSFLEFGFDAPQGGVTDLVTAMPGWVVVGCPDYVPDMGHFVSLWDLAFARAVAAIEAKKVIAQSGEHRLIQLATELDTYKKCDYSVHIHPLLCLFEDVRFVSGEANRDPEGRSTPPENRGHNIHGSGAPPPADPDPAKTEKARMEHGGILISARTRQTEFRDATKLKGTDPSRPIDEWLKRAIFLRLRRPGTLYTDRKFIIDPPTAPEGRYPGSFPRKVGRRMDYDGGPDKDKFYEFPTHKKHDGNLLKFHGLAHANKLCGGSESPPTAGPDPANPLSASDLTLLGFIDDMYWPATFRDMPLLRELAFTPLQYGQFEAWAATSDPRYVEDKLFNAIVSPALLLSLGKPGDPDAHFADFQAARPLYAPAMIDMAHLGAMLGGSFLPGIEVGREAGIDRNWCLFHGATTDFPTIRFMRADIDEDHKVGTLTKDLAVPWTDDFRRCEESWWPTSRPGRTTKDAVTLTRHNWQIEDTRVPKDDVKFVKEYWKALGFIRRDLKNQFIEQEQSWH